MAARTAAREARDPAHQAYDLMRAGRCRLRCHCRRRQHGSPAENRHDGAPRGRPGCKGRPAFRSRGRRASHARHNRRVRLSALRHPLFGGRTRKRKDDADAERRRGMERNAARLKRRTAQLIDTDAAIVSWASEARPGTQGPEQKRCLGTSPRCTGSRRRARHRAPSMQLGARLAGTREAECSA